MFRNAKMKSELRLRPFHICYLAPCQDKRPNLA
jgi:hypothetical protein